ncbi:MAG: type I-E CRISPR-associated protein Cse1/CasA [Myxococcota bacterium]
MTQLTNLLTDRWLDVRRASGALDTIAPGRLTERIDDDPIVDVVTPRPDFRSALYQFLIALLQTACPPDDDDDWLNKWDAPPNSVELEVKFAPFAPAFVVRGDGPLFLQDRSAADGKVVPIAELLLDEPGENGIKENRDLFVKRGRIRGLSARTGVAALMTMQCMAPSGGAGHRTSLRGGGPLSTLLAPVEPSAQSLWRRIWLNVLDRDAWRLVPGLQGEPTLNGLTFPWMDAIRTSDKEGVCTTPEDAHSLQHYWAMPRRILLDWNDDGTLRCPLSGDAVAVSRFCRKPHGVHYQGPWQHPLSPHYRAKDGAALPFHPQPGGFAYRLWSEWTRMSRGDEPSTLCALVVSNHLQSPVRSEVPARLWASGYDMDNMKPRCFYERSWPLFRFAPDVAEYARAAIDAAVTVATCAARDLRSHVRKAWLRRPTDHSDSKNNLSFAIESHFYTASEPGFFDRLSQLHDYCEGRRRAPLDGEKWRQELEELALRTFDAYVPVESLADGDAARIARARNGLSGSLRAKTNRAAVEEIENAMDLIRGARDAR